MPFKIPIRQGAQRRQLIRLDQLQLFPPRLLFQVLAGGEISDHTGHRVSECHADCGLANRNRP